MIVNASIGFTIITAFKMLYMSQASLTLILTS